MEQFSDPFLDLIRLLHPQAILWSRIDAVGHWGLSFRKRDDLLFCWVEQGSCLLTRTSTNPVPLGKDDFVLIRTSEPFALVSDLATQPQDSETVVAATGSVSFSLGSGTGSPVILRGGKFVFNSANEALLWGLIPSLLHVAASDTSSASVRTLLQMNDAEARQPGHGSEFIVTRLMELILVEILRDKAIQPDPQQTGLLAGLANPITAQALAAMHRDVARSWTVASLARLCGVSRSTFATRFRAIVGTGPIEYLSHWRIALAKDELRRGSRTIAEIAIAIGFQSSSAFSTAFTRAVGVSPKRFAAQP